MQNQDKSIDDAESAYKVAKDKLNFNKKQAAMKWFNEIETANEVYKLSMNKCPCKE